MALKKAIDTPVPMDDDDDDDLAEPSKEEQGGGYGPDEVLRQAAQGDAAPSILVRVDCSMPDDDLAEPSKDEQGGGSYGPNEVLHQAALGDAAPSILVRVDCGLPGTEGRSVQSSGNDLPFPVAELVMKERPYSKRSATWPDQLRCLYWSLGVHEVPASEVQQSLQIRAALPVQLKPPRGAKLGADGRVDVHRDPAGSTDLEVEEWRHIVAASTWERGLWGSFDDAPFPLLRPAARMLRDRGSDSQPADPLSFRATMHADATGLVTKVEPGEKVWRMVEQTLLNVIPKDVWEANAQGGFCRREARQQPPQPAVEDDWCCAVCLEETPTALAILKCGHVFHELCLSRWWWRSSRCPLCRRRAHWSPGPPLLHPDMDFELQPWPMLPDGVIARDEPTVAQLEVLASRQAAKGPDAIFRRLRRLSKWFFGGGAAIRGFRRYRRSPAPPEPSPRFFEELLPSEACSLVGPAVVAERWRSAREQAAEALELRAAAGSQVVCWPQDRRWPALPLDARMESRRAVITARLRARGTSGEPAG